MSAKIDKNTCTGCESCISTCPVEAIAMTGGKAAVDTEKCVDCGACVSACPVDAISL
ncbi:MAG: ferredoxin [Dethiosulfovibrio peptidovorans]|nr:MAG: ferredoxin [Dethiosulfovibrio peptidovorans]